MRCAKTVVCKNLSCKSSASFQEIYIWCSQIAGIAFPVPIMLLVPLREHVLPKLLPAAELTALDDAPYDQDQVTLKDVGATPSLESVTSGSVTQADRRLNADSTIAAGGPEQVAV